MKSKNLRPNFKVPLTTVINIYTEILAKAIEETNHAILNSKKTNTSFRNSECGIEDLTIIL